MNNAIGFYYSAEKDNCKGKVDDPILKQIPQPHQPGQKEKINFKKFPLFYALEQMNGYTKFMKDLLTKKRVVIFEVAGWLHHYSMITSQSYVEKKEDPRTFTISYAIRPFHFIRSLCDLRASINLMLRVVYKQFVLGEPKPTFMRLLMVIFIVKRSVSTL